MPIRPVAQKITITSTSTGGSTQVARFGVGMAVASAAYTFTGTTKNKSFTLQGALGSTSVWFNLSAATTASTAAGGAVVTSTATAVFDKVRLNVTADASTGNGTLVAWVGAHP